MKKIAVIVLALVFSVVVMPMVKAADATKAAPAKAKVEEKKAEPKAEAKAPKRDNKADKNAKPAITTADAPAAKK